MKIAMIDPWGINNTVHYLNGICMGISTFVDLTLFCNFHYKKTTDAKYEVKPVFFRKSQIMKEGRFRQLIRGIEYIIAYRKIIKTLKKKDYDIVHIQWLLMYKIDIHYLKQIKKYCNKLVYTAHNIVPHLNSEKYMDDLIQVYNIVDKVVLHGEGIKDEFAALFPDFIEKVVIQCHGTNLLQNTQFKIEIINRDIIEKIERYDKIYIFFGQIFYNKGVDRLVKIWLSKFRNYNQLLIIAGKKDSDYKELDDLEEEINACNNIMYINEYVEDNLLNYLISKSDLIILPYRHASMSGVIFSAADFCKPVLCTNVGSLLEYIIDNENSFVANSDEEIINKMDYIANKLSKEDLVEMGNNLNVYITNNFSWDSIGEKIVSDCYQ